MFARVYGARGYMVVLDHGQTYYTVYSGLGSVSVQVGDWVGGGASLGTLADADVPALFFQVRRGAQSLDARAWMAP